MRSLHATRISRPVRWLLGVIAVLLLLVLCLGLVDWNAARGPLGRMISHHIDRQVVLGGALRGHLFSSTPSADVENLKNVNSNMIELTRLHVAVVLSQLFLGRLVLQTLEIDNPKVSLLRDETGRANWDFSNEAAKSTNQKPTRLPPLRRFALRGGNLKVNDAIRKLTFDGTVGAAESGGGQTSEPFRLEGQGTLNKEPFKLNFEGDALLDIKLDHP